MRWFAMKAGETEIFSMKAANPARRGEDTQGTGIYSMGGPYLPLLGGNARRRPPKRAGQGAWAPRGRWIASLARGPVR